MNHKYEYNNVPTSYINYWDFGITKNIKKYKIINKCKIRQQVIFRYINLKLQN